MVEHADSLPLLDPLGGRAKGVKRLDWAARMPRMPGVRLAIGAAVWTRLVFWAAALATIAIFGENAIARHMLDPSNVTMSGRTSALNTLLSSSARWDSVWYLEISAHGYFSPLTANFFPVYPLLIHAGALVTGNGLVAGVAISAISTVVALTLLYRLAALDLSESAARLTVMLAAAFPTSLFLSAVYPTSVFLVFTLGAIYAARRERWALAGICGALAAATRSNGFLLVIPLALMYLYGPRGRMPVVDRARAIWRPRFPVERDMAWLVLAPAGLAAYLGYLWVAHGDPFAPYRAAHLYWDHSFGPPLAGTVDALADVPGDLLALVGHAGTKIGPGDPTSWQARNLADVSFLILALTGVALAWKRVPRVYVIYALVQLAFVTSVPSANEPMIGLSRYLLPMFALFMGAGAYLAERRTAARVTLAVSTLLLALFSGLWAFWSLVP